TAARASARGEIADGVAAATVAGQARLIGVAGPRSVAAGRTVEPAAGLRVAARRVRACSSVCREFAGAQKQREREDGAGTRHVSLSFPASLQWREGRLRLKKSLGPAGWTNVGLDGNGVLPQLARRRVHIRYRNDSGATAAKCARA